MSKIISLLILLSLISLSFSTKDKPNLSEKNSIARNYSVIGADFEELEEIRVEEGVFIDLSLDYFNYTGPVKSLETRVYNRQLPGPIIRAFPGQTLQIQLHNNLHWQESANYCNNGYGQPDTTNLHFHGVHCSNARPADDVTLGINPGESYNYTVDIVDEHMPGAFWIHPHLHGSSTLQVGGGAAVVFIIEDPPGYLPEQITQWKEVVINLQYFLTNNITLAARGCGDSMWKATPGTVSDERNFTLLNGLYQPVFHIQPGEWQRWRWIFSGFTEDFQNILIDHAEVVLLAKDGIYIYDFPRKIQMVRLTSGCRADVMVRFNKPGLYRIISYGTLIGRVDVSGDGVDSDILTSWTPEFPYYLGDQTNNKATDGCICLTSQGQGCPCINMRYWDEDMYLHTAFIGAVIERIIWGAYEHPYHQHTYPFQMMKGFVADDFFRVGDWQDGYQETIWINENLRIKYHPTDFPGRIMLHCHSLMHEDNGMMAQEYIFQEGDECTCGYTDSDATNILFITEINANILKVISSLIIGIMSLLLI